MYAIVEISGKQYKVKEKDVIWVDRLDKEVGEEFEVDKVLLLRKDDKVEIDPKELKNVKIKCEVLNHVKGEKIIVFKKKKRKNYRRKKGHRQKYTEIMIKEIKEG